MNAPSKIHLTTRAYLAAWASRGELRPVHIEFGRQKPKSPAAVAWRREWWGAGNPDLNRACEEACSPLEGLMPAVLRQLESRWPLELNERALVAQFIALHVVRTPAFAGWFAEAREQSLSQYRDEFDTPAQYEQFTKVMRSDHERAGKMLRLINKLATLIGSMHWTLLRFDEPLLITGDQPVCPVPLLPPGAEQQVAPMPAGGWLDTLEVRFPLSPSLALLGTWHVRPQTRPVEGTWAQAVNLNGAVRAQANRHWVHVVERQPALPPAVLREPVTRFEPISPSILPGYGTQAALRSDLRQETKRAVERLIERQDETTLALITAEVRAAA